MTGMAFAAWPAFYNVPQWNIPAMSAFGSKSTSGQDTVMEGVFLKPDGTKAYLAGAQNDRLYQYSLSTPWDVTTLTYDNIFVSISAQDPNQLQDIFISPDGLNLYMVGSGADRVFQYTFGTAWELSTLTYPGKSVSVSGQDSVPQGVALSNDGAKMFVVGSTTDAVYQYTLSTPWDVSTATYDLVSFSVASQTLQPQGVFFNPNGLQMFVSSFSPARVFQYRLLTAWDLTTATHQSTLTVAGGPSGLCISDRGSKLFYNDDSGNLLRQYNAPA